MVSLSDSPGINSIRGIEIAVSDDGTGFSTEDHRPDSSSNHVGLGIMKERARRIDGHLKIESSPETGSCIRLIIPVPDNIA